MREIRFGVVTMALLGLVAVCAGAQNISLAVDAAKVPQKLLDVEEVLPVTAGPLTLYCPKWIPGENADGPVSNLANLKFDTDGTVVPWTRDLLDIWSFTQMYRRARRSCTSRSTISKARVAIVCSCTWVTRRLGKLVVVSTCSEVEESLRRSQTERPEQ
jgi:hypothetical protein